MRILTLLTDFGNKDPYVGIMKGVVLSMVDTHIVDITHEIPHGDIRRAAFFLKYYPFYFPDGTVHLIVVDPTVGSKRRGIVSLYKGHYFVAPDNGVLTPVLGEVYRIDREPASHTFHGRDVFSPVAGELLLGKPLEKIGERIHDPVRIEFPVPVVNQDNITGEVIIIDRFGNLITNIPSDNVGKDDFVEYRGHEIPIVKSYSDVEPGKPLALVNSYGLFEIGINQGSAEAFFKGKIGDRVKIRRYHG